MIAACHFLLTEAACIFSGGLGKVHVFLGFSENLRLGRLNLWISLIITDSSDVTL